MDKIRKLFDIKKTQLQLVIDRGYQLHEDEEIILKSNNIQHFIDFIRKSTQQTGKSIRDSLSRIYSYARATGENKCMLVYYGSKLDSQQVSASVVREFIRNIQNPKYNIYEAILIIDGGLSTTAKDELSAVKLIKWQIFFDNELTYNPVTHISVPQHILLSEEEEKTLIQKIKTPKTKLLLTKINDPIVKYYGWQIGNIIRVHRDDSGLSILSPKSINYRVIVD